LQAAGIPFTVVVADIPEVRRPEESPRVFAERLAKEKALAVAATHPEELVLGADTIVVLDAEVLGKPRDVDDAARMLRLLSGKEHEVITAICLAGNGITEVQSALTRVSMDQISGEEIAAYVASGEPMDKAGAYAIQGWASRWVTKIEGDYSNVVGLPVPLVWKMLRERGLTRIS
jgi:septum formation protein